MRESHQVAVSIRRHALAAPLVALAQSGCSSSSSSCDGFRSQRVEVRIGEDEAGITDAGSLSAAQGCLTFCEQHGAYGVDLQCRVEPDMERSLGEGIPRDLVERAGLPAPSVAVAVLRQARQELYS